MYAEGVARVARMARQWILSTKKLKFVGVGLGHANSFSVCCSTAPKTNMRLISNAFVPSLRGSQCEPQCEISPAFDTIFPNACCACSACIYSRSSKLRSIRLPRFLLTVV